PCGRGPPAAPGRVGARAPLAGSAGTAARREEMLARIEQVLRASPAGDQALAMRALRAWATRDAQAIGEVQVELQRARAITVAIAFADVALYARNLEGASDLARGFLPVARAPELRALCHVMLAHPALAAGNGAGARAALTEAEALDRTWGVEMRALFAALPFADATAADIRAAHAALDGLRSVEPAPSS